MFYPNNNASTNPFFNTIDSIAFFNYANKIKGQVKIARVNRDGRRSPLLSEMAMDASCIISLRKRDAKCVQDKMAIIKTKQANPNPFSFTEKYCQLVSFELTQVKNQINTSYKVEKQIAPTVIKKIEIATIKENKPTHVNLPKKTVPNQQSTNIFKDKRIDDTYNNLTQSKASEESKIASVFDSFVFYCKCVKDCDNKSLTVALLIAKNYTVRQMGMLLYKKSKLDYNNISTADKASLWKTSGLYLSNVEERLEWCKVAVFLNNTDEFYNYFFINSRGHDEILRFIDYEKVKNLTDSNDPKEIYNKKYWTINDLHVYSGIPIKKILHATSNEELRIYGESYKKSFFEQQDALNWLLLQNKKKRAALK